MYFCLVLQFVSLIFLSVGAEKCLMGERQSPIDIVSKEARYQEFRPFTVSRHDGLSIRKGTLYAKNTGDTLKLYAVSNHTKALLGGGPLTVDYEFVEIHFHWGDEQKVGGSEHSIDEQKYPLELHMVHRNIHDETVSEAFKHENGLTVLGFKFQLVKESETASEGVDTLAKIAEKFLVDTGSKFSKGDIEKEFKADEDVNVVNFLPVLMDEYFHYHGSLTTGGCEESVNWIVFKNPLAIKEKHLKAFQSLKNKNGANIANNFLPIQSVNDRPIYYHGIALIQSKTISRGSSSGLRTMKLPLHSDYLLSVPSCPSSPRPAIMADKEEQRDADKLWQNKPCITASSGTKCEVYLAVLACAVIFT